MLCRIGLVVVMACGGGGGGNGGAKDAAIGVDGARDAAPDAGSTFPGRRVVWIGDSYNVTGNEGLRNGVQNRARTAGALGATDAYRAFYVGGTQIANGQIPAQYTAAVADDPVISAVIMNGGGNDVAIGNPGCLSNPPPTNAACVTLFQNVVATLETLWADMAGDGVAHVVFFYYPELGITGGTENVNYSAPLIRDACEARTDLDCRFVDPRAAFMGQAYLESNGVYPNAAGLDVLAGLIWSEMVVGQIAQAP